MAIDSRNTFVYSPLDLFTVCAFAAGTTLPIASTAAQAASVRSVCKRVGVTLSAPAAGQVAPVGVILRDSATSPAQTSGVSVKKCYQISLGLAAVSAGLCCVNIDEDNLHIAGSTATAMTLEFIGTTGGSTTPVAASISSATLQGYAFPKANSTTVTNAA
jgi:hypothetical protein